MRRPGPRPTAGPGQRPFSTGRRDHDAAADVSAEWQYPPMTLETTTDTETGNECSACAASGVCSNCDGTGEGSDGRDCGRCGGAGLVTIEHCCVCEHAVSEHSDYTCACEEG